MFLARNLIGSSGPERHRLLVQQFAREMEIGLAEVAKLGAGPYVSVFGTARSEVDSPAYLLPKRLGYKLGSRGINVIEGGGPGAMAGVAEGAREAGAIAVNVCLRLPREEAPNPFGNINLHHQFFPTRKSIFIEHSIGFVHVPGGFGTLDELSEVLVHIQCGMSANVPVYLLDSDFWLPFDKWVREKMLGRKLIGEDDVKRYIITDDEDEVAEGLAKFAREQGYAVK